MSSLCFANQGYQSKPGDKQSSDEMDNVRHFDKTRKKIYAFRKN